LQDEVATLLDGNNISYVKKPKEFRLTLDRELVDMHSQAIRSIAEYVRRSWQSEG
jgi:hypothetical protein